MGADNKVQLDIFFALAEDDVRFALYRRFQSIFFAASIAVFGGSCILAFMRLFPTVSQLSYLFWLIAAAVVVNAIFAYRMYKMVKQRWVAFHVASVMAMGASQAVFLFSYPSWLPRSYLGLALMCASVLIATFSSRMASDLASEAEAKSIRQIKETRSRYVKLFEDERVNERLSFDIPEVNPPSSP